MTAIDTEKEKLLEELGLSWALMIVSKGQSATDKMPQSIEHRRDPSSSSRTQLNICSALISWQSIASKEKIEETMLRHCEAMFGYILQILSSGGDSEASLPDIQTPAYYLTSCIQRQMRNPPSSSFAAEMMPSVLNIIRCLTQSAMFLKEKQGNAAETNVSSRTGSVKLLIKCIPIVGDSFASESIAALFSFMKLVSATMTPTLRKEVIGWLLAIGKRNITLFNHHISGLVGAMRFGEADELITILQSNLRIFTEIAPQVLEQNIHYLVTSLGFPSLSVALLKIAGTESGAAKLSGSVPTLIKDMKQIKTAQAVPSLMAVLLKIALVRPESVSRHINICIDVCKAGRRDSTLPRLNQIEQSRQEELTSVLLLSIVKLLAAVSRAGVEETYSSLASLSTILRTGRAKTVIEQSALIGAIDVAKNKCPKGNVFAEDTLAALSLLSATNRLSYANIMKWNNGKWALESDV